MSEEKVYSYQIETRFCSIEGCDAKHVGRGWCAAHLQRWRIHGDVFESIPIRDSTKFYLTPRKIRICDIDGCDKRHRSLGLCESHYVLLRREEAKKREDKDMKKNSAQKFTRICDKEDCFEKHVAKGMCVNHYQYAYRHNLLDDLIKPEDIDTLEVGNEELRKVNSGLTAQLHKALTNQKNELKAEQEDLRKAIAKFEVA